MKSKRLLSVIAALLALSMIMTAALMSSCSNKTGGGGTSTADAGTTSAPTSDTADVPTVEQPKFKYSGKRLTTSRVSVHDPSIVYEPDSGKYYLFGSHKAWAVSDDLASWKTFTIPSLEVNNASLFAPNIAWSAHGGSQGQAQYSVEGNMWAPDVIYNEDMGKWCMYMSINGDRYYSSIVLLTADAITGPYKYVGTIVYSGFLNAAQAAETNFNEVTGGEKTLSRYLQNSAWNAQYGPNAIDPCVLYDKDGQLWMSYGSWFGGIFLLKLDNKTGLRDLTETYPTEKNVSDAYFGYRISGGYGGTGEGSYIVWDEAAGYYYLYLSYCGLNATDGFSGYHIRLFRSEDIKGPYVDSMGHEAVLTAAGQSQDRKGIKLMGNYSFSSFKTSGDNNSAGYMSGGHNSAFIDTDGQRYLIYHTRFNVGQEWHEVRVHQQFLNEDGWPVTAVYEFQGSVISYNGYDEADIVGEYEFVDHGTDSTTPNVPNPPVGMLETKKLTLNADGTISGDVTGTWDEHRGADGIGYYTTMKIGNATYKGVFFEQFDESATHKKTMTFTLIGDNDHAIFGSKI